MIVRRKIARGEVQEGGGDWPVTGRLVCADGGWR